MAEPQRLFGTDGIRGEAGRYPLDTITLRRIGAALAEVLMESGLGQRVLLGRDTRLSGPEVERELASGLQSCGVEVARAGVITTPAVASLVLSDGFAAGIAISASHNPYYDNGIKVFSSDGFKLSEALEKRVEARILDVGVQPPGEARAAHNALDEPLRERYLTSLLESMAAPRTLAGLRVVLDCGHGAATDFAPEVFRRAGAEVTTLGNQPNGRNINDGCGALHPQRLAEEVVNRRGQLGAAFDGDADRAIFVDETGTIRDGDFVLAILAPILKQADRLGGNEVVGTVMSNIGLEETLGRDGIGLARTRVGDKYVLEEMRRRGVLLGGEPSGHIIFLEHSTTGDGILTALRLASVVADSGQTLSQLASTLRKAPQVLLNVPVARRAPLEDFEAWRDAMAEAERAVGERGRVVVRFSGTEALLRVMVEGPDAEIVSSEAERLCRTAQDLLES